MTRDAVIPTPLDDTRLWRPADVARYLGISPRTVRDLPGLPRVELPGTSRRPILRFHPDDVRAWADARRTGRRAA